MFVPKGCVLLTAAVDRLAEARRTAGQTNDDGTERGPGGAKGRIS